MYIYIYTWFYGNRASLQNCSSCAADMLRKMPRFAWKYALQAISYPLRSSSSHQTANLVLNQCSSAIFSSSELNHLQIRVSISGSEYIQTLTYMYAVPSLPHCLTFAAWGINSFFFLSSSSLFINPFLNGQTVTHNLKVCMPVRSILHCFTKPYSLIGGLVRWCSVCHISYLKSKKLFFLVKVLVVVLQSVITNKDKAIRICD